MSWILFAFLSAFATAASTLLTKAFSKSHQILQVYWISSVFCGLPILYSLSNTATLPILYGKYIWYLLGSAALNTVALVLFMQAIRRTDVSVIAPLTCLFPVFSLLTVTLFTSDQLSLLGGVGVCLAAFGVYITALSEKQSWTFPFQMLRTDYGAKRVVFVTLLWSLSVTLDKQAIGVVDPILWVACLSTLVQLNLGLLYLIKKPIPLEPLSARLLRDCGLLGLASATADISYFLALRSANASYVVALRQSNIIFVVLFGIFVLREGNRRTRLIGAGVLSFASILLAVL